MAESQLRQPKRRLFPRYRRVYNASFVGAVLLAVPLVLLGPGQDGSLLRGAATAVAALLLSVLINHQGGVYVGRRGLGVVSACFIHRAVRWSEIEAAQVSDLGLQFTTSRGIIRIDAGCWRWADLLEAVAYYLKPAAAARLQAAAASRQPGFEAFGSNRWSWPSIWLIFGGVMVLGLLQFTIHVADGQLQARIYFQAFLMLLVGIRAVMSDRTVTSVEVDPYELRVQTVGEGHKMAWSDVLSVVDSPWRWTIRTQQGDFAIPKRYHDARGVHDALVARGVPRVVYDPTVPIVWVNGR